MKKLFATFVPILIVLGIFFHFSPSASAEKRPMTKISNTELSAETPVVAADSAAVKTEKSFGDQLWYYTKGITILAFFAFAIVYITMTLVKKPRFTPITIEEMKAKRREKGKPEVSEADDATAIGLADRAFNTWTVNSKPGEQESRTATTMAQIKASHASLAAAIDLMPTDKETVDRINELGGIINNLEKRYFTGSMKLIYCGIAACVLAYFMGDGFTSFFKHFWWLPATIVLYYFASMSPEFLNIKRDRWFKGFNIHNVLIATVLGLFASTPATETWKTTYTDGSSKKSEEINPFFIIMFIITIIVVVVLGFFTFVFAGLNFVRNYLIYV